MTARLTGSHHGSTSPSFAPDLYTGETPAESAHKTWAMVQRDLAHALGSNVHRSWTGRLHIAGADAFSVTFSAPSRFIASKIDNTYSDELRRLWKKHDRVAPPRDIIISKPGASSKVSLDHVNTSPAGVTDSSIKKGPSAIHTRKNGLVSTPPSDEPVKPDGPRHRFTFDNFVIGPSNEFAFAVARQVAGDNRAQYNPVVIHGSNGMGKTHLLYAVKQAIHCSDPSRRVQLISGENFVSTFVSSVRGSNRDAIETFKASMRNVDLLIIDDAHFIAAKPNSQEELLHTLMSLIDDGRQVLLATDRHPDEMDKASDRLKSVLCNGLVCKIGPAEYEMRVRLLDRLIARRRDNGNPTLIVPQNARDHLAARINATPRDLEGAFNQVVAQSEILGMPITLETIQNALSDRRYQSGQRLTVDRIQRVVAEEFGVTLDDMVSKRRARAVARPRQVAMYLCKKLTKRSLPDIGRRFGGRDHTTVMHAVKRIKELRVEDALLDGKIQSAEQSLQS